MAGSAPFFAGLVLLGLSSGCSLDWGNHGRPGDAGEGPDELDGGAVVEGESEAGAGQGDAAYGDLDSGAVGTGEDGAAESDAGDAATVPVADAGPLPPCGPGPCQHGNCSGDGQRCECPATWTGATCGDDVDECVVPTTACPPDDGMPCHNTQGGFTCLGQLADWRIPSTNRSASELSVHPDGSTTFDKLTGLMWERMAPGTLFSFLDAESHCRDLRLGGYSNWRIPALIEYFSLFTGNPYPGTPQELLASGLSGLFYSNTANAAGSGVWCIRMETGIPELCPASALFSPVVPVRCVRTAEDKFVGLPRDRYLTDSAQGLVTDQRTGLTFERQSESSTRTFAAAQQHCTENARAGRSWRLPSAVELLSTVDALLAAPAASRAFAGTFAPSWSSTQAKSAATHLCVDLQTGQPAAFGNDVSNCVTRCVSGP